MSLPNLQSRPTVRLQTTSDPTPAVLVVIAAYPQLSVSAISLGPV